MTPTRPPAQPGTPSLLRAINDKAALHALLERGPLTRPQIGALTGLSKPTASQLLARLQEAGLVVLDGIREGLPGRTAEVYRLNPAAAYAAALDVTPARIAAAVADITGTVVGEHTLPTPRSRGDLVAKVRAALDGALAGEPGARPHRVVIGIQGALDPGTGRLGYAAHIPGWHTPDLLGTLREGLGVPVDVENDVNLVALAERDHGAAIGHQTFVLLWADEGLGAALVIGGALHRGATGGAGEVGYMPAIGAPTAREVGRHATHGFQALSGGPAVRALLREHGVRGPRGAGGTAATVRNAVAAAENGDERAEAGLRELAGRLALGLASITAVVDPELVVLTGGTLLAGGEHLRALVERELHALTLPRPPVRLSTVRGNPVISGALGLALAATREEVFGSTVPGA
ncbi:putative NBD/HSP70 family sugar kinase [Thermocatellispora tengchongensis]|uniref:Putative NBD/HSP70 family sugar kinase n=1 Tax=Thermocatellispora tengchongensis TaxID=1073253 RepID=A0A840PJ56_9ACTN|nr:ROK family transcriptional regulator [Thermocatellispora tengchongensis]MBB5138999.1 putative NBD/HSP70 family sugar kinase [Thermocatellispora tengchongensis]